MWAREIWPYVNGKALMSGLRLKEMEASEMLDVIHFFFEEDHSVSGEPELYIRSGTRSNMYKLLYGREYKHAVKEKHEDTSHAVPVYSSAPGYDYNEPYIPSGTEDSPFDPRDELKPFIPATNFDPGSGRFPGLDAPLG